jgi:hypothetical protein
MLWVRPASGALATRALAFGARAAATLANGALDVMATAATGVAGSAPAPRSLVASAAGGAGGLATGGVTVTIGVATGVGCSDRVTAEARYAPAFGSPWRSTVARAALASACVAARIGCEPAAGALPSGAAASRRARDDLRSSFATGSVAARGLGCGFARAAVRRAALDPSGGSAGPSGSTDVHSGSRSPRTGSADVSSTTFAMDDQHPARTNAATA